MIKTHMLLFPPPKGAGSGKSAKQNRVGTGGARDESRVKDELETDFLLKRKDFEEKKI
jgi:hypothetical protein